MFGFGMGELLLVCSIMLLLFGKRIPGVMRSLGECANSFRKGMIDEEISENQNLIS